MLKIIKLKQLEPTVTLKASERKLVAMDLMQKVVLALLWEKTAIFKILRAPLQGLTSQVQKRQIHILLRAVGPECSLDNI
jgi:hypothetical protein